MAHNHQNSTDETHLYENNQELLYQGHSHGTKDLWRVFIWLLIITIVDVILYFVMPPTLGRNIIFIALGMVKVFLIVGTFMHLKQEKMGLILTIVLPIIFIVGLILGLLYEGGALA